MFCYFQPHYIHLINSLKLIKDVASVRMRSILSYSVLFASDDSFRLKGREAARDILIQTEDLFRRNSYGKTTLFDVVIFFLSEKIIHFDRIKKTCWKCVNIVRSVFSLYVLRYDYDPNHEFSLDVHLVKNVRLRGLSLWLENSSLRKRRICNFKNDCHALHRRGGGLAAETVSAVGRCPQVGQVGGRDHQRVHDVFARSSGFKTLYEK